MPKETNEIAAVLDEDLEGVLEKIGVLNDLRADRLKCWICRDTITIESLELIVPLEAGTKFICSRESCVTMFALGETEDAESS